MIGQVVRGSDGGPRVGGVCYQQAGQTGVTTYGGRVGLNYKIN